MALGTLALLQTLPAMLMLSFMGVIIDREDRRLLVMCLDALRVVVAADTKSHDASPLATPRRSTEYRAPSGC